MYNHLSVQRVQRMERRRYSRDRTYFVWKTEEPYPEKVSRVSSKFSVFGLDLYLELAAVQSLKGLMWLIKLNSLQLYIGDGFQVTTYFQTNRRELATFGNVPKTIDVLSRGTAIWGKLVSEFITRRDEFMKNGAFTFVFVFDEVIGDRRVLDAFSTVREKRAAAPPSELCLSSDMERLYEHGEHSDVVVKCGGRTFPAHRAVLSARSEVFAAMFRHKMAESETGRVDIADLDPEIVEVLLRYLYSGKAERPTSATVPQLCLAADKYAVHPLKRECLAFMVENLDKRNACSVLAFVHRFGDPERLEAVIDFILREKGFLESEQWNKFEREHSGVVGKVFEGYRKRPADGSLVSVPEKDIKGRIFTSTSLSAKPFQRQP